MLESQALDYLILPMPPTPNGRMHIGHAAGPYLRADALARNLRRSGHSVMVASGSDAFENWVLMEAWRNDEPPLATCLRNHELIKRDFSHLDIAFDLWINPLDDAHARPYAELHERLLAELAGNEAAFLVSERVPVSAHSGEYVIGAWVAGDCPQCAQPVAGNSCVKCGAGFQPEEIRNPRSRRDDGELRWIEKQSWFVDCNAPETMLASLERSGVGEHFIDIVTRHIERAGTRARISQPGTWGMKSELVDPDCVLTNTFYGFALYCAQAAAKAAGLALSVLETGSQATVVALFGKDNAGIGLVAPLTISLCSERYRSFDRIVVNHLLHFEGSKCSTSRRHGIWISELIENTSVTGDELRFVLAQMPLESEAASLSIAELLSSINELRFFRADILSAACAVASNGSAEAIAAKARDAIERQSKELQPHHLQLSAASAVLRQWMFDPSISTANADEVRAWLTGFVLLAEPIVPGLASEVRKYLESRGDSRVWEVRRFAPLSAAEVAPYAHISADAV